MTLHVHHLGPDDGTPMLALHGVTGHGARFATLASRLDGVRLVAPDLRGHGRSPADPPWSIEQHVADLVAVMEAEGLSQVSVLGHSFGGALALHLQRAVPARVQRLILLDPALGLPAPLALERARAAAVGEAFASVEEARWAKAESWAGVDLALVEAEAREHLEQCADGLWRWRYEPAAAAATWGEMARAAVVPRTRVPVTVLVAGRAEVVQPGWVERLCAGAPADVHRMDLGHMLWLEDLDAVAQHVQIAVGIGVR